MRPTTADHGPATCIGPCGRELAPTNQPSLLDSDASDAAAPHHKHVTVCVDCIAGGYLPPERDDDTLEPQVKTPDVVAPPAPVPCPGCDRNLTVNPNPTLFEAATTPATGPVPHPDHPTVCTDCIGRGFVPPPARLRRDVVIDNCEFYLETNVGLTEAAAREGYGDRSHLDSVLRRWGRLDLTHALGALDPVQIRERL